VSGAVHATRDGSVGWIVIDHPERRNALTGEMFRALAAGLAELDADPSVRVIVMRGAGTTAFASGADIGDLGRVSGNASSTSSGTAPGGPLVAADKPIVAMIHGVCIGGGLLVALAADVRVCADDARFAIPAIRLGVAYPYDGVQQLVAAVGPTAAGDILLTGSTFGAEEALRWGLVSRVVPAIGLEGAVAEMTSAMASGAPLSVRAAKRSIKAATSGEPADAADAAIRACWASEDFAEGRRAFAEKRAPVFRGR
jgi:enoyl-CoA hydratase/carnithine racemase